MRVIGGGGTVDVGCPVVEDGGEVSCASEERAKHT
jgi:hypothetical protein